jgi:hypothetical protein
LSSDILLVEAGQTIIPVSGVSGIFCGQYQYKQNHRLDRQVFVANTRYLCIFEEDLQ